MKLLGFLSILITSTTLLHCSGTGGRRVQGIACAKDHNTTGLEMNDKVATKVSQKSEEAFDQLAKGTYAYAGTQVTYKALTKEKYQSGDPKYLTIDFMDLKSTKKGEEETWVLKTQCVSNITPEHIAKFKASGALGIDIVTAINANKDGSFSYQVDEYMFQFKNQKDDSLKLLKSGQSTVNKSPKDAFNATNQPYAVYQHNKRKDFFEVRYSYNVGKDEVVTVSTKYTFAAAPADSPEPPTAKEEDKEPEDPADDNGADDTGDSNDDEIGFEG